MLMSAAFLLSALIQFALGLIVAWILGAAEFGVYALALSAAILAQTLAFEWIRLAATRFHHAGSGGALRQRLARLLAGLAAGMLTMAVLALIFWQGFGQGFGDGFRFGRASLITLIPLLAAVTGYADFRAALLRAEFSQKRYAGFLMMRNIFAALLLPLSAWYFGRAEPVLLAFLASIALASLLLFWPVPGADAGSAVDDETAPDLPDLFHYSAPIVATNALYLGLFFVLRAAVAAAGGLASAGQASLALDFTLKLFTTVGTAFDLVLFQAVLRDDREKGAVAGQARLQQNLMWLLMLVVPMAIGLGFVATRLEPFLVAPEFRGTFVAFVLAFLPGVALYALLQYGLHAAFQLQKRTRPLLVAAALAFGMTLPAFGMMHLADVPLARGAGLAMLAGMGAGFGYLARQWPKEARPDKSFWRGLGIAVAVQAAALAGLEYATPVQDWGSLVAMIFSGIASYGLAIWGLDLGGIRRMLSTW
jgi:O-antigen/teichoic acid export membrane protein